ncbi:MAG: AAA family ATPase [Chitinophagales bacterium]
MKYTKFEIENFKGIQNLTLDLEKKPTSKIITLVGLNECGKTSILEAINFLHKDQPDSQKHKLIPKKDKLKFNGSVIVRGDLSLNKEDNIRIKEFAKTIGVLDIKPIKLLSISNESLFDNSNFIKSKHTWELYISIKNKESDDFVEIDDQNEIWKKIADYIEDNLLPKILYYPDFLFNFPNKIYLDKDFSKTKKQEQFRDIIQDILSSIDIDLTIEDHLINRIKDSSEGVQEALEHTLSKMSSKISKVVLEAWKNIMNIKGKEFSVDAKSEKITEQVKNQQGAKVNKQRNVYYLEFKLKEGTEKYFISERSLGFKWFFTFLLFTEFRKNRKTDLGETIFLLDEPASNLHSTAQKKLLAKFSNLVSSKCRLIYTTHSHHLINPKWLEGAYIIRNEAIDYKRGFDFDTNNTNINAIPYKKFVATHPKQQDYFQPILDALEYQPGLLEKIPGIILTEGKFDFYILKYIDQVYLNNKYKHLHFYPGNGADGNDQVIRLYMAWGRDYKILLDGNGGGEKAKKRYKKVFGEVIQNHISTFTDINSDFDYAIEDLFKTNEKLNITKLFDEKASTFNKSKFNTMIQSLLLQKKKVDISEETIKKFKEIFDYLDC